MPYRKCSSYDPNLRKSEAGRRLYPYWQKVRHEPHAEEFDDFPDFHAWALCNGYTIGAKLCKIDESKLYSPENCIWKSKAERQAEREAAREAEKMARKEEKAKAKTKTTTERPKTDERIIRSRDQPMIHSWNQMVNKIRIANGLPPFPEGGEN